MENWVEIEVRLPLAAQEAVTAWFLDRGATGVQEDYPGLYPGDGPVVSGDPGEWSGEPPANPGPDVLLVAWLPPPAQPEREGAALTAYLRDLDEVVPGVADAPVAAWALPEQDWNAEWKASWEPLPVGHGLLVCPSWITPPDAPGRRILKLDPGMAFGTGTHFTTSSCLEFVEIAMERAAVPPQVLDVGTGSGILAIAALLMGAPSAFGIDVDADAVNEALENADRNAVGDRFRATAEPLSGEEGRFGLVLANIIAQAILRLADPLAASVAPGGFLVTSGVLRCHEDEVGGAMEQRGLVRADVRRDDTWVTTLWQRPA
jgi:ribosomal protein L11 methyltransferase